MQGSRGLKQGEAGVGTLKHVEGKPWVQGSGEPVQGEGRAEILKQREGKPWVQGSQGL